MQEGIEAMLQARERAPEFVLPSSNGTDVALGTLRGRIVVLYFYPKDNTPGCTLEAQEFRDHQAALAELGATVLGVSPDSVKSHCRFAEKQRLNFVLLADTDHVVAERYGVWVEKKMYGKAFWGIQRATFLIDRDGRIAHVWPKVSPQDHAEEVLEAVRNL